MVIIISSNGWLVKRPGYWGFSEAQKVVGKMIMQYVIANGKQVYMISGDIHMVGFDDGSNNEYGFPVIQAAALDGYPTCAGGPYSHGAFPGSG